jgi:uncharacterized protein (TIGR03437 family)
MQSTLLIGLALLTTALDAQFIPPTITNVTPVFGYDSVIQPGSWVSIYGTGLACGISSWNGIFTEFLVSTYVTVNNKFAYLSYASPTQLNIQVPDDTTRGPVDVQVGFPYGCENGAPDVGADFTVTLAAWSPSFSLFDSSHPAAEIATPDGSGAYGRGTYDLLGPVGAFSFASRPVKPGEILILYGVGFGPTSPTVPAGQSFFGAAPTIEPIQITIGGEIAPIQFSGIVSAGLYQFNVTVPNFAESGNYQLRATVNGIQAQPDIVVSVE